MDSYSRIKLGVLSGTESRPGCRMRSCGLKNVVRPAEKREQGWDGVKTVFGSFVDVTESYTVAQTQVPWGQRGRVA